MKKNYLLLVCLVGPGLMTGCCPTGCFVQTKSFPSPPDLGFWEKFGVSDEQKEADWISCGGQKDGFLNPPVEGGRDTKFIYEEWEMKNITFQRCLMGKGYRWTGQCTSAWMKTTPACGTP